MKKTFLLFLLLYISIFSQVENVLISNDVYDFLHEMKVKGIVERIHRDDPSMSRGEIVTQLHIIEKKITKLSSTERARLNKFLIEFDYSRINDDNTTRFFDYRDGLNVNFPGIISNKQKFAYFYQDSVFTNTTTIHPAITYAWTNHADMVDARWLRLGGETFGTIAGNFGYYLSIDTDLMLGSRRLITYINPITQTDTKFILNQEKISNASGTNGYVRYQTTPYEDMQISVQIGREPQTLGFGYGSKLIMSEDAPEMNFLKFTFSYGAVRFRSTHFSTVGPWSEDITQRYTKHIATNALYLTFPKYFTVGLGEAVIYGNRGIEMGYLNPLGFYKYLEQNMQDRDNGLFYGEFQAHFIKNFEFQLTIMLDETPDFGDWTDQMNKTAMQIGAMWYQAFTIPDLSLFAEVTQIRPYVYSHRFEYSNYESYGLPIGHRIGPNAQEFFFKAAYNFGSRLRTEISFTRTTSGENVYDNDGNLVTNYGGDPQYYNEPFSTQKLEIGDGELVDAGRLDFKLKYEFIKDYYAEFNYSMEKINDRHEHVVSDINYYWVRLIFNY